METLIVCNLILTAILLFVVVRPLVFRPKKFAREWYEKSLAAAVENLTDAQKWFEQEKNARGIRPIHHPPVNGPTTAALTRGHGYWRTKDDPKAEPFLAAWYEKDTTFSGPLAGEDVIPADTYVDLTGRKIPGPKFRAYYEPSEAVMVVSKVKPKAKTHTTNLVTASADAPQLSPEEEERLAEEYELGGQVAEPRSAQ